MTMPRSAPSMPVADVAARFSISIWRVYQLSRPQPGTPHKDPKPAFLQRQYISHAHFEITMASVAAYEAYIHSLNELNAKQYSPIQALDFSRGVLV